MSLEGSAPLVLTSSQNDIVGYGNIGAGGGLLFPLAPCSVRKQAREERANLRLHRHRWLRQYRCRRRFALSSRACFRTEQGRMALHATVEPERSERAS